MDKTQKNKQSLSFSNGRLKKIVELHAKRDEAIKKLEELHKNFRGVHHEDSASEIKYTQIMVLESFVESLNEEIKSIENKQSL